MLAGMLEFLMRAEGGAMVFGAIFLRVGAAMALMPGFGEQAVPLRVKLGLSIAFSAIVWPLVLSSGLTLPASELTPFLFLSEPVAGLALGLFFRLFVVALQLAGMMAAQATSLAQIFGGGATPDPMPAFGNLLVIGGLALAMISGFHVRLTVALARSYVVIPMGVLPAGDDLTGWGVEGIARAFGFAFSLAAPFVIASLVYNVALGVINRAMPQLMVSFVGAPAITLGGLLILAITAPGMLVLWLHRMDASLVAPLGTGF